MRISYTICHFTADYVVEFKRETSHTGEKENPKIKLLCKGRSERREENFQNHIPFGAVDVIFMLLETLPRIKMSMAVKFMVTATVENSNFPNTLIKRRAARKNSEFLEKLNRKSFLSYFNPVKTNKFIFACQISTLVG